MDLIKQLEIYRLEHRITLQELADSLGVKYSTVCRWFKGTFKPNKIHEYHIKQLITSKYTI